MWLKALFIISKVLVFEEPLIATYVAIKNEDIQTTLLLHMVKNVIKGSFCFKIVFEVNSYVCLMKILDYFIIAIKNMIKGSFPISTSCSYFEGNSYVL